MYYYCLLVTDSLFFTDHNPGTASETQPLFAMSGDNNDDVNIPMLFLFHQEGHALINAWKEHAGLQVMMTDKVMIFGKALIVLFRSREYHIYCKYWDNRSEQTA